MLTFGLILLGATMFAHGWWHAGVTEARTTGLLAAVAGLAMAASVLAPAAVFGSVPVAVSTLVVLWAIYALLVAGNGLLDFGTRALGFYAIYAAVAYVLYAIWFLVRSDVANPIGAMATLILAAAFFLLFLEAAPPFPRLTRVVAWIFILGGAAISLFGFGSLFGLA